MALPQNGVFRDINKIGLEDLNNELQVLIGLISDDHDKLGDISIGATKVEVDLVADPIKGDINADNGYITLDGKRTNVYTHPDTHHVSMITGLSVMATSNDYNDLINRPKELPASDVYDWAKQPEKPTYLPNEVGAIPATAKGTINGVAELDKYGRLPKDQLPENLQDYCNQGYIPQVQLPTIDITKNLIDNNSIVLILGGMNSSLQSGGITKEDLEAAKAEDLSAELYPGAGIPTDPGTEEGGGEEETEPAA